MNHRELYMQLVNLNQTELYYKKCYEEGISPENFYPEFNPYQMQEDLLFPAKQLPFRQEIILKKHQCYSPTSPHHHDYFELFYVLNGKTNQILCQKQIAMQKGDFCLIPPGVTHHIDIKDDSSIINILIRRTAYERIFSNLLNDKNIITIFFSSHTYGLGTNDYMIFHSGDDVTLRKLVLDMYEECEKKENYYEILLNTQLTSLFGYLLRRYENTCEFPAISNRLEAHIFEMIHYMHQNYTDITLPKLADEFNYTPNYTSKLIHDVTGKTFSAILTQIRMEHAIQLLNTTTLSIANIAASLGYMTTEHFIRTFKKTYNTTPSNYRKETMYA